MSAIVGRCQGCKAAVNRRWPSCLVCGRPLPEGKERVRIEAAEMERQGAVPNPLSGPAGWSPFAVGRA